MAQTGMKDIKRRIRGIRNTRQITKGMELVATAKLRKARNRFEETRAYFETIVSTVRDIAAGSSNVKNPFLEEREVRRELFIVVTSDRGLCGGYNINIIKEVMSRLEDGKEYAFIAIGRRGRDYLRARGYELAGDYAGISESPRYADATQIGDIAAGMFRQGRVDRVSIAYTRFVSTISQEPRIMTLLPVASGENKAREKTEEDIMTYEPSPEAVLETLIPLYVHGFLFGALVEASASEQAARRMAMESATGNANKMIDELILSYNRARQEIITREISEIVGGAEAINR